MASYRRVLPGDVKRAYPKQDRRDSFAASHLEVRMFNVGEGEAILVIFPDNATWLIDCGSTNFNGPNKTLGQRLAQYLNNRGLRLQSLIPSHPHKDHGGGFVYLLQSNPPLADDIWLYRCGDSTWNPATGWIPTFKAELANLGPRLHEVVLTNQHREVTVEPGVEAHFFAGSGEGKYTSVFLHLRFHDAGLLFTGDSYCDYEIRLLDRYGETDFRADILKVTHHGSSSGTAQTVVDAVQQGISIASTAEDGGHRLEQDTLDRLGGHGNPRRVYETVVDGDIILRTDGLDYRGGILYQVEFNRPGEFAADGATMLDLDDVNAQRTISPHAECD